MSYATQEEIGLAMNLNYSMTQDNNNGSRFKRGIKKGDRHIWSTRSGWQTADLVDNRYINHQEFNELTDALRREV